MAYRSATAEVFVDTLTDLPTSDDLENDLDALTELPKLENLDEHFKLLLDSYYTDKNELIPVIMVRLNFGRTTKVDLTEEEAAEMYRLLASRLNYRYIQGFSSVAMLSPNLYGLVLLNPEGKKPVGFISKQARQVLTAINRPVVLSNNQTIKIKATVGIACYPCDGGSLPTLLEKAARAVEKVIDSRKNQYLFYSRY